MQPVTVRDTTIGSGHPIYCVAELGTCHEGSLDCALALARAAAEAGFDCVKTETFQKDAILFDPEATFSYTLRGEVITEKLADHMERTELTFAEHEAIRRECQNLDVAFMSTAHDREGVDFLVDIGADAIKIASPDIVNGPLLDYAASSGIPLFIDTGGAVDDEILRARRRLAERGFNQAVFNHHPGGHPTPAEEYNFNTIHHLKSMLDVPVGTADHFDGYLMAFAATAVGVDAIEKPISFDRFLRAPEHIYSIAVKDLGDVLRSIRAIEAARGSAHARKIRKNPHRSAVVAKRDLAEGERLSLDNVRFGRPAHGIPVEYWDVVEGRSIKRPIRSGGFVAWDDI